MRPYGKIAPQFWIGETGRQLRSAGAEVQLVALYLLSSPHANMLGCYYLPLGFIAHETGLTLQATRQALDRAAVIGFCAYDNASEVVWVFEMARFQVGEQLETSDKRCKGIEKEYLALPANQFLCAFFDKYSGCFHMTERRGNQVDEGKPHRRPSEAPSKALRSQEQEQEKEQEQEHAARFARWWEAYPRKEAKKDALKAWMKLRVDDDLLEKMLQAVDRQRKTDAWTKDKGAYIPHPATWLNGDRWKDETASPKPKAADDLPRCDCGAVGVIKIGGERWRCREHREAA
jgi:hypothetical protein